MQGANQKRRTALINAAYYTLFGIVIYVLAKYALPVFLPFITAFLFSLFLRPVVDAAENRLRIPRQVTSLLCITVLFVFITCLLFLFLDRFFFELKGLLALIADNSENAASFFSQKILYLYHRLPFLKNAAGEEEILSEAANVGIEMLKNLSYKIPELIAGLLSALPDVILVSLSFFISLYYFCSLKTDAPSLVISKLEGRKKENAQEVYGKVINALSSVAKSYLLIMFVTFIQLFVGFSILRIEYAFALALLTSVIDILPVLGIGTVILPYASVKFIFGEIGTGVGLIVMFLVISVIREVLEPKLIGKTSGIHPLCAIISLYAGFRLLGFIGLIIAPVAAIIIKSVITEKTQKNTGP